jgi:hypothetical protein
MGGKQERFFCRLGWKADDRASVQSGRDPADQLEAPIASIQADHVRANRVETQWLLQSGATSMADLVNGDEYVGHWRLFLQLLVPHVLIKSEAGLYATRLV